MQLSMKLRGAQPLLRLCILALAASTALAESPSLEKQVRSWEDVKSHEKHRPAVRHKIAWKQESDKDGEARTAEGPGDTQAVAEKVPLAEGETRAKVMQDDDKYSLPFSNLLPENTSIQEMPPWERKLEGFRHPDKVSDIQKPDPVWKGVEKLTANTENRQELSTQQTQKDAQHPARIGMASGTGTDNTDLYDNLRNAMVRISTLDRSTNIMRPYEAAAGQESVGSGFIVDFPSVSDGPDDITIITNAHVVKSGQTVRVQLPALGRKFFDAEVPLICFKFDLAIVKLAYSSELSDQLALSNSSIQRLRLQSRFVEMGLRVAALGFPLGSEWLKLSEGVIAGEESVNENMVYQSTAPISPGNSGGPLLVFRTIGDKVLLDTVLGANFATEGSSTAQNLNYVVPAFRIKQVLKLYGKLRQGPKEKIEEVGTGSEQHVTMRLPPVGLVYTQSTAAQIANSKCMTGIQIDKIKTYSIFRWAEPPIPVGSFLVKIDDAELDVFGMGKRPDYMQSAVSFKDLLTFRSSLDEEVNLTTCKDGQSTMHKLSLHWNSTRFESGLRLVEEPAFDAGINSYELFAGVTLMQLTQNHIEQWTSQEGYDTLARFSLDEAQATPRVAITACTPGSLCEDILSGGMILESINHCNGVKTLREVRSCFVPQGAYWELVTDRGFVFVADFVEELRNTVAIGSSHLMTKAVMAALKAGALPGYNDKEATDNQIMLQNNPIGRLLSEEESARRMMRRA
eukprot:CAMPEP_0197698134 /NCGR_PEP_ID=MMETSP1338-20131121/118904_1 /TAXON_ID=43686 ORGANISM="Pelagodinium beii, Strain RCC1491" /NCGR_SAMPLE_ID=MMETSP1338 /ASSEMBLY_ACC=CAM_ASM_000754 /LENGTH=738 /DNA_ID=CAMNT_0043281463 /DNA_START=80 /DNA_END=2292 /DNA_ORIENTATION=-